MNVCARCGYPIPFDTRILPYCDDRRACEVRQALAALDAENALARRGPDV